MEQNQSDGVGPERIAALSQEAIDFQTTPARLVELSALEEVRALAAANAGMPADHLETLSKDESEAVRLAVAQNPNTPLDCLLLLAREFPEALFLNPLCSLLNLAQPDWHRRIDDFTWLYLLKSEKIPRSWLKWLEQQKRREYKHVHVVARGAADAYGVWGAARLHVGMPDIHTNGEHIGRDLASCISLVAHNPRTPRPILQELASIVCQYESISEIGTAVCEQIPRSLARNSALPEHGQILHSLASNKDPLVRHAIAGHPFVPLDILESLADDPSAYVRAGVAANPVAPPALLERLTIDNTYEEKYERAKKQIAPNARLHEMSRMQAQEALHGITLFKGALAGNQATPAHVLALLATHPELEIRERLAANPAAPPDALLSLTTDVERVLWILVEKNPCTPAEALTRLALHANGRIRIGVARHPETPAEVLAHLAGDSDVRVRETVAGNVHTPAAVLTSLVDGDITVRSALAKNPVTPHEILTRLSEDAHPRVLDALAKNPALPTKLIEKFIMDEDKEIRLRIARHPGLPQVSLECLERLMQDNDSQIQKVLQRRLARLNALGERGQQCFRYLYRMDDENKESSGFSSDVLLNMPLYEIQARSLEQTPPLLPDFLARFELSEDQRQEIFELVLVAWSQRWKARASEGQAWFSLLAKIDLTPDWQRTFATSPLWQERYFMAVRPGIATSLLEQLSSDGNRYVRAAASWYLQERQK